MPQVKKEKSKMSISKIIIVALWFIITLIFKLKNGVQEKAPAD